MSTGDGVDAATVAVINEICERALQSDVAAAIAAARAIAGVTWHFLSKCMYFDHCRKFNQHLLNATFTLAPSSTY